MSSGENGRTGETGRVLAGRYRVVGQLGRGGMGVVWRAVDDVLGREVAVKELRTYNDADGPELAGLRLRMQREARAAARVRHPGVVAVHDVTEVDGRPLIVMELVDGPSLDDVLRERGTLDPREAAGIGAKVMDALAAAHRAGVLHRDVKPGNILLDRSGRVVLTDFGIATMEDPGDGSATHLTRSGELVGSLDYLAPERAQGADPGPASDVWALGATLYAAVEGTSPFRRTSTFSTLTAIVTEPLPESANAGPLGPVLQRLMDKRPEGRPEAEEARELLQTVADARGTDSQTTTLRGTAGTAPVETERVVPSVPPGFGPAGQAPGPDGVGGPERGSATAQGAGNPAPGSATAQGFGMPPQGQATGQGFGPPAQGTPGQVAPAAQGFGAPVHGGPPPAGFGAADPAPKDPAATASVDTARLPRRRGRALLAAAAVTVVLASAGVTVALLNGTGDAEAGGPTPSATRSGATSTVGGRGDVAPTDDSAPTERGDEKTPSASASPDRTPESTASGRATAAPAPTKTSGGGGTGATPSGDGTTPAPSCSATGRGTYDCVVWKTADSYTADGTKVGILKAGTNYFYCQQNLGRRETSGEWTNVWWAKTDDDSGNTNVFVSVVYVKGGDNDEPVPGLPVC
ncbi:serine/threonine-protein kinase [Streptomyces sp. S.PB5]|uniref:serine/threonine-protein kinase n=1 Tax=Streptomyces sp. S.PB5 TaxID=3020844 RepID=UPI0025B0FA47|nr:serine/threonine-protein kinase [Streptomyces sp. S.PB5]MDN3025756.1 protein kinase [Streptomyces sp. S.PB5]